NMASGEQRPGLGAGRGDGHRWRHPDQGGTGGGRDAARELPRSQDSLHQRGRRNTRTACRTGTSTAFPPWTADHLQLPRVSLADPSVGLPAQRVERRRDKGLGDGTSILSTPPLRAGPPRYSGSTIRNTCGTTTRAMISAGRNPSARAASCCATGTAAKPPRKISIVNAVLLIASAATPAVRALIGIPYRGRTRNRI